ncbi:MAG: hypothetical protein RLZZ305_833 [Actinomycetota bacterium]
MAATTGGENAGVLWDTRGEASGDPGTGRGEDAPHIAGCLLLLAPADRVAGMATPTLPKFPKLNVPQINLPKLDIPKVTLPKVTLPKVDLTKVSLPAIHSIDLTNVDLRKGAEAVLANPVVKQARDAGYTAIGFVVLGVQKLQVRRRELTAEISARRNTAQ